MLPFPIANLFLTQILTVLLTIFFLLKTLITKNHGKHLKNVTRQIFLTISIFVNTSLPSNLRQMNTNITKLQKFIYLPYVQK